jgi:hypothetical protein
MSRLALCLAVVVALLALIYPSAVVAWTKVRDERMPEEIRLVNEGIAHGKGGTA